MATWKDEATTRISWTKRPQSLGTEIDNLERSHSTDLTLARVLMRLYWNRPLSSRTLPGASTDVDIERYAMMANQLANQLGFNLLRDLVDGMAARVCRDMACKVITVGGDSQLHQQSTKMSRLLDGLNAECKTREVAEKAFIDACTCRGFGAIKVYFDKNSEELKLMRVDPLTVFFRFSEGENPRNLFVRSTVPREYLQDTYPSKADAIAKVSQQRARATVVGVEPAGVTYDDTVQVNEGWKLSTGDKPGRWVMTCGQVVLENEPYPYDFHQIVLFRVLPEYTGAGGVSIARIAAPYHRWLNQLVRIAHDSFRGNVPRIVHHVDTKINEGGISDVPYSEVIWEGQEAPTVQAGNAVSEQLLNFLPVLRQQAHVDTGINEAMAGGLKPVGINSGAALREYRDFADARLNGPNERWSQLWADIGKTFIGIASDHYKNKAVVVRAPGSAVLQEIKWSQVDLKKSKYRLQFDVTSGLSQTVAGKMQDVQDLQNMGLADALDAAEMLKSTLPDIAAFADRITAPRKLALQMVEEALDGIPQVPSSLFGPDCLNAIQLIGTQMYAKALVDKNRTPEQLEVLRKLIKAARRKTAPPLPAVQTMLPAPAIAPNAIVPASLPGPVPAPMPLPPGPLPGAPQGAATNLPPLP